MLHEGDVVGFELTIPGGHSRATPSSIPDVEEAAYDARVSAPENPICGMPVGCRAKRICHIVLKAIHAENAKMTLSRRSIIVAGAAYMCGFPAMALGSNTSIESMLDEVRKQLLDRSDFRPDIDVTNRMIADDLRELVWDKSAYGTTCKGKVYVLAFQPEGRGLLQIEDEPLEVGQWWISDDGHTIHSQWPIAADGEELSLYYRELDGGLFAARTLDDRRCSLFFIGETPPELKAV